MPAGGKVSQFDEEAVSCIGRLLNSKSGMSEARPAKDVLLFREGKQRTSPRDIGFVSVVSTAALLAALSY